MSSFRCMCRRYYSVCTLTPHFQQNLRIIRTQHLPNSQKASLFLFSKRTCSSTRIDNKQKSYYEVLGVSQTATQSQIKEAFYDISKAHHPDKRTSGSSVEKFKRANEAYSVLSDEDQRTSYDQELRLSESPLGQQQFRMRQKQEYAARRDSEYSNEKFRSNEGRILVAKKNPIDPSELHKFGYNYELWSIGHYGKNTGSWMPENKNSAEAENRRKAVSKGLEAARERRARLRAGSTSQTGSTTGPPFGVEAIFSVGLIVLIVLFTIGSKS